MWAFQIMYLSYENKETVSHYVKKNKLYEYLSEVKSGPLLILRSFSPYLYNYASYRDDEFELLKFFQNEPFSLRTKFYLNAHEYIVKYIKDKYKSIMYVLARFTFLRII